MKKALHLILALIFLLEEWIWDTLAFLMESVSAYRAVRFVEARIRKLPPRFALIAFLLPSLVTAPVSLGEVYAIEHQHWLLGAVIFIAGKLLGMALFSRIFNLTRPALMSIAWFARFYAQVMKYRNWVHDFVKSLAVYRIVRYRVRLMKRKLAWMKGG
jgi:hypothetical protein